MKGPSPTTHRHLSNSPSAQVTRGFSHSPEKTAFNEAIDHIYSLMHSGRLSDALENCRQLLAIQPDQIETLFTMAVLQQHLGKTNEAVSTYRHLMGLSPGQVEAAYNLGVLHQQRGEVEAAEQCYRHALLHDSDFVSAHKNLGALLMSQGRWEAADDCFERISQIDPQNVDGHFGRGRCLSQQGRFKQAAECFGKSVEINPDFVQGWHHRGLSCQQMGQYEQALSHMKTGLELSPRSSDLYFDIGNVYLDLQDMESVVSWYRMGVSHCPGNIDRLQNLARLLQEQGLFQEAIEYYRKIIEIDPEHGDAHFDLSLLLLRSGNYEEGWSEYEWRLKKPQWAKYFPRIDRQARWQGENFSGKRLLVNCEQGFGDSIQFVRYLPMVKARGGEVILDTPGPLMSVFQTITGVDRINRLVPGSAPVDDFDCYAPLLSLPGIFQTRPASIPCRVPYLFPDPAKVSHWRQRVDAGKGRIGIVWAGSKVHLNDSRRSCKLENFLPLTRIPNLQIYSLQTEVSIEDMQTCHVSEKIIHWGNRFNDFSDTAAAIANLDLLISVDTAAAHLAGAMGKRVWLLLPYIPDWRWSIERSDCPWYPSMRLFRQRAPGEWPSVFEQVGEALHRFLDHLSSDHQDV